MFQWHGRIGRSVLLGMLLACSAGNAPDPMTDEDAIKAVLAMQERAWDQGDITQFMAGYAAEVCFIGRRGRTCGREAVARNYRKNYPSKAAMGDLHFEITELLPAGEGFAWMTGSWELVRTSDTLGGGFSLLWQKGTEGWRIVRDHTY